VCTRGDRWEISLPGVFRSCSRARGDEPGDARGRAKAAAGGAYAVLAEGVSGLPRAEPVAATTPGSGAPGETRTPRLHSRPTMRTPSEALDLILEHTPAPSASERVPLLEAAGRCLAVPALSDVDLPPFEKSMMDGFALAASSAERLPVRLRVLGESRAGQPHGAGDGPDSPTSPIPPGACVEIFTGAELPPGCDAVEMVEHVGREGDTIELTRPLRAGQNVSHRGEILRSGGTVYEPRRRLSAADLSVLASIGCDPVAVFTRPRVSVLTTGDELVPPGRRPGRGQIREGNTFYLAAACRALGCELVRSGIVPDRAEELERTFASALEDSDVLITTGGVSVGKYDLVGAAFERLGVEPLLHKVAVKPGKPIWFGRRASTLVFGLPGNPVSTLLGFEVFVRGALVRLCGDDPRLEAERIRRGRWCGPDLRGGDRQNNLPARLRQLPDEGWGVDELEPLPFRGSADIVCAAQADALVIVPVGGEVKSGAAVDYRPLPGPGIPRGPRGSTP